MSTTNQIDTLPEEVAKSNSAADSILLAPIARLLLTPKEAAALRISPRLLWSLTRDGTIKAIRLRSAVRYSPDSLAEFIKQASTEK